MNQKLAAGETAYVVSSLGGPEEIGQFGQVGFDGAWPNEKRKKEGERP